MSTAREFMHRMPPELEKTELRQWWSHGCSHYLPQESGSSDDLYLKMFSSWIGSILCSLPSSEGWRESFCKDQETANSVIINLAIILKLLQCGFKRSFLWQFSYVKTEQVAKQKATIIQADLHYSSKKLSKRDCLLLNYVQQRCLAKEITFSLIMYSKWHSQK